MTHTMYDCPPLMTVPNYSKTIPYNLALLLDKPQPNQFDKAYMCRVGIQVNAHYPSQINFPHLPLEGISSGLHVWNITWKVNERPNHALLGVVTKDATNMHGCDKESWCWDLVHNTVLHGSVSQRIIPYPRHLRHRTSMSMQYHNPKHLLNRAGLFLPSDSVKLVLDMDAGTLAFIADGKYLGTAAGGLKGLTLFPAFSTIYEGQECEVKIEYLKGLSSKS